MKKILFLCDLVGFYGGTEQYIYSTYKSLKKREYEVYIIGAKITSKPWDNDPNIFVMPELFLRKKKDVYRIKTILNQINPDIIYLHNLQEIELKKLSTILKFYPTVRFIHDTRSFCINQYKLKNHIKPCFCSFGINCLLCDKNFLKPKYSYLQTKEIIKALWFNKKNDRLIVASNYMKKNLIINKLHPSRIEILPYFTEIPEIKTENVKFENFILYVGQIQQHKGIQYLIESLKFINTKLKLFIIGDGPYLSFCMQLVNKLSLKERVVFLKWRPNSELAYFYQRCYLTCIPSFYEEPFGIVGIESLANYKPVIAFNSGGISDWLQDKKFGFLINRGDVKTLSEKIDFLYCHPEIARKMGEEGRKFVIDNYSENKHISQLERIFQKLLKSK